MSAMRARKALLREYKETGNADAKREADDYTDIIGHNIRADRDDADRYDKYPDGPDIE